MKKIFLSVIVIFYVIAANASVSDLPVKEWLVDKHDKPLLFYITGDGGFNDFSTGFCKLLSQSGYDVLALNARSYFWDKKTPQQTTADIAHYINGHLKGRENQEVVMIGYSFGADVMPFIVNRIGDSIAVKNTFLMAPSSSTDFEIHWSDILGGNKKRDMDVAAEVNRMTENKLVIITGSDETNFPFRTLTLKKYTHEVLPGGHHFDGDTAEVKAVILKHL